MATLKVLCLLKHEPGRTCTFSQEVSLLAYTIEVIFLA